MTRAMLDGLRIVTVSQFGAGPFGTQFLADLGAEVIKIEDPGVGGDVARHVGPYAGDHDSLYFQSFNRGKKSLTLDLTHADGRAVLRDLARVSHAVYNNLRGDLPARLGLTYAALKDANPAIVCCSLSGFGATGPRAPEPAFDYLIQGYAGWMSVTASRTARRSRPASPWSTSRAATRRWPRCWRGSGARLAPAAGAPPRCRGPTPR